MSEAKLLAALQQRGPSSLSELVAAGVMSSERLLLKVVKASEGRILQDGPRLFLPGQDAEGDVPEVDGVLSHYVIFDLETTSADPEAAEIIELAAVKVCDGQEVGCFQRLVRGPRVTKEVAQLTGIDNEMLLGGDELDMVLGDFLSWAGPLPLLGHNALKYDLPVLRRALSSVGRELGNRPVLDSLLLAPLAFALEQDVPEVYSLESLYARLAGAAHEQAHRALADCRATLTVVNACTARLLAMPEGVQRVLTALPVPEFQLAWPLATCDVEAFKPELDALLRTQAERTHVQVVGGVEAKHPADLLPNPRPGQERMLDDVSTTLLKGGVSVIEAPTGTGKTRGYLYPALLQGKPGHPIIISTHTRQLQNQILDEARAVKDAGFNLNVLALKGQSNYLCPARLRDWLIGKHDGDQHQLVLPPGEARAAAFLLLHLQKGEFADLPPAPLRWTSDYQRLTQTVATQRARCGEACAFHASCAFYPLFDARTKANVVVVNHALLFQTLLQGKDDLAGLPIEKVVVDEAHDLGEAAYAALRREVSVQSLRALGNELLKIRPRRLGERATSRGQELLDLLNRQDAQLTGLPSVLGTLRTQLQAAPQSPHLLIAPVERWLSGQPLLPKELLSSYLRWRDRTAVVQGFLSGASIEAHKRGENEMVTAILRLTPRLSELQERLSDWQVKLRAFAMQYGEGGGGFGYTAAVTLQLQGSPEFKAARDHGKGLLPPLSGLSGYVRDLGRYPAIRDEATLLTQRLDAAREALQGLLERDPGEDVYAVSASDDNGSVWSVPLWLHARLAPLWQGLKAVTMTSATLRIPGSEPAQGEGDVSDFGLFQKSSVCRPPAFWPCPRCFPMTWARCCSPTTCR